MEYRSRALDPASENSGQRLGRARPRSARCVVRAALFKIIASCNSDTYWGYISDWNARVGAKGSTAGTRHMESMDAPTASQGLSGTFDPAPTPHRYLG